VPFTPPNIVRLLTFAAAWAIFSALILSGQVRTADRIHPGDLIEIDESGGFDFDWRGKLNPEGYLEGFTKVTDPIFARCRTTEELAEEVRLAYSKTLREPFVRVRILDRSGRALAYLDGAIKQPLRLQIKREVHLSELIVIGGGFTDKTSGEITIFRPVGQSCEADTDEALGLVKVNISDILAGVAAANPKIVSGDIVTVLPVQHVYVIGGVNNSGKVAWRDGATVSRVVAAAGGVSDKGVSGMVSVYRRQQDGGKVFELDLDKVIDGKAKDLEVRPFDIIDVPLKGTSKRTRPPVIDDPESRSQPVPLRVID
jgi:protein involved in polysaccharide export with SLBB domain